MFFINSYSLNFHYSFCIHLIGFMITQFLTRSSHLNIKGQITNLLKETNPKISKTKSEREWYCTYTNFMNTSFCYLKFSKYGIFSVYL